MVISVRLKPAKSCLQPRILSDDLSDFNQNWNSKPELAGVMVCCLAGRTKTERPKRATALLGAYWCKTCHNYLPLWPPLPRILTGMLSGSRHNRVTGFWDSFSSPSLTPPTSSRMSPPSFPRPDPFFPHELFSGRTGGLSGSAAIKRVSALKTVRPLFRLCSVKSSLNNNSHLWRLIKLASSLHWRRGASDFFSPSRVKFLLLIREPTLRRRQGHVKESRVGWGNLQI